MSTYPCLPVAHTYYTHTHTKVLVLMGLISHYLWNRTAWVNYCKSTVLGWNNVLLLKYLCVHIKFDVLFSQFSCLKKWLFRCAIL